MCVLQKKAKKKNCESGDQFLLSRIVRSHRVTMQRSIQIKLTNE